MKLLHAAALAVLTLSGAVHGSAIQTTSNMKLIERQSTATCLAGSNSAPASEVEAANSNLCAALDGTDIVGGQQESTMRIVSTGDLSLIVYNTSPKDEIVNGNTCLYVLNVLTASCSEINNEFSHGKISFGSFTYESEMLPNHKVIESRDIANNSGCFPGNASAPVAEVQAISADLCGYYVNATIVPGEAYTYDYQIPEGDLIFKLRNVCETNVKLDNETCYCGFEKVMQQCATADGRFVNGTIDNECLRLNTWVNATRLEQLQPGVSPVTVNGTNSTNAERDVSTNLARDIPICSIDSTSGASTPYTQDPRDDTRAAIYHFCTQYDGESMHPVMSFTEDVPLNTVPNQGPAHFTFNSSCPDFTTFDGVTCEDALMKNIDSTYLDCRHIQGTGPLLHDCQSVSMIVGPQLGSADPSVKRRDDDTFHCPGIATTPYKQDPRVDTAGAIFTFCARYTGDQMDNNLHIDADIPLATYPSEGPASFSYQNSCNKHVDFNAAQCEQGLLSTINASYYACEFLHGQTDAGDGCQTMSYLLAI